MSDKFYVGETNVGKGLFAKRKINAGEEILIFEGSAVTSKQAERLDLEKYGKSMGNALQTGKDRYIYLKEPGRIANHSCNPNAGIKDDIKLVAIRDIPKGEEIRWDYSTSMDEDYWTMKCRCGEKNCRRVIKDFKYLPRDLRGRYLRLGIVQSFIVKQYSKGKSAEK